MAGRKVKSVEQHKRDGTFRKCRHKQLGEVEESLDDQLKCPKDITGLQRKFYLDAVSHLTKLGTLKETDDKAIRHAAQLYELVEKTGKLVRNDPTDKDARCSYTAYSEKYMSYLKEFGFTPATRGRVFNALNSSIDTKKKTTPIADLMKKATGN